jgi:hypothetical protein
MSIAVASFLIGAALIFIAILGSGIEAKEVQIPVLNFWARILSFAFGLSLIAFGLGNELWSSNRPTVFAEVNKRGPVWATVVLYSDNLVAGSDLPKYKKEADWRDAYVVHLKSWCPKADKLDVLLPAPVGRLTTMDCHL